MSNETPNILLVEEDETLADITSFRLELLGYDVRQVHTGEAALESVHRDKPELAIVDLYLPGIDGVELINRLKNDQATSDIPIMVFSTDSDLNVVSTRVRTITWLRRTTRPCCKRRSKSCYRLRE